MDRAEVYSRSKGLLEVMTLMEKRVLIVGLGSFGSQIALELAKAGVGRFSLFDFDRLEAHNLVRHIGYVKDIGRLKTDVVREAIIGKNPDATVDAFDIDINTDVNALEREMAKSDIVICATDNNRSRYIISEALMRLKKTGVFGRAVTRAEGGDVFIYRPGGACYCCLTGLKGLPADEISSEEAGRRSGNIPQYASADDVDAVVQVGLSVDIAPICNLMEKIALMELSRGTDSGISSLESDLTYNYYVWANRRDRLYGKWAAFPDAASRPTIMRWYGANIAKAEGCALCSETPELDEEVDFAALSSVEVNMDTEGLSL